MVAMDVSPCRASYQEIDIRQSTVRYGEPNWIATPNETYSSLVLCCEKRKEDTNSQPPPGSVSSSGVVPPFEPLPGVGPSPGLPSVFSLGSMTASGAELAGLPVFFAVLLSVSLMAAHLLE